MNAVPVVFFEVGVDVECYVQGVEVREESLAEGLPAVETWHCCYFVGFVLATGWVGGFEIVWYGP